MHAIREGEAPAEPQSRCVYLLRGSAGASPSRCLCPKCLTYKNASPRCPTPIHCQFCGLRRNIDKNLRRTHKLFGNESAISNRHIERISKLLVGQGLPQPHHLSACKDGARDALWSTDSEALTVGVWRDCLYRDLHDFSAPHFSAISITFSAVRRVLAEKLRAEKWNFRP
jgi:hypothetical protein